MQHIPVSLCRRDIGGLEVVHRSYGRGLAVVDVGEDCGQILDCRPVSDYTRWMMDDGCLDTAVTKGSGCKLSGPPGLVELGPTVTVGKALHGWVLLSN